ncbi:hypothetical protein [uncultured Legionella sp.]|uniref:hypothetical protein n=1 Tax=uncultured Legionella sp. TaxID=210934 RepID=UPI00260A413A|nr:hypothetical protein [uncultured Legionella sp.]
MKKISLLSVLSALSFSSVIHAGGMGDSNFCCSAFISLEGGYSWNAIDGYNFALIGTNDYITSTENKDQYSARLAAGMINMMDDQFGVTGELGWGYYGKTTLNPTTPTQALIQGNLNIAHTLSGFDALLGVAYMQPCYSFSFKAGALIQNMQIHTTATDAFASGLADTYSLKENKTAVLPEIKLGAAYNFNENWSLTGTFMVAFGSKTQTTGEFNINTGTSHLSINNQNPSISSAMLGVQYTV